MMDILNTGSIMTVFPFAVALALTHLIVLPMKSFFLSPEQRKPVNRASIGNLIAVAYFMLVFVGFDADPTEPFWAWVKIAPILVLMVYSLGVWLRLMATGPRYLLAVDILVYTVIAFAAA